MSTGNHLAKIFSAGEENTSEKKIADIAEENPYCSIAQFYLLQSLKKNGLPGFEKQAGKTVLYFSSNHWLNWKLHLYSKPDIENDTIGSGELEVAETKNSVKNVEQAIFSKPSPQKNKIEDIAAFEPLHTVDYFASQGIRITDEPIANDKLGSQMKSFTEWLKSMKNIHAQIPEESDQHQEIQHIAEDSNVKTDVLTEAMAEVLIKQKKHDKAIEMYEKLCLINPSKSAYFATKIQSLKSI